MEKETKNKNTLTIILVIIGVLVLTGGAASVAAFGFHRVGTKNLGNQRFSRNMNGGNFGRGGMMGRGGGNFGNVRVSGDITKIDGNTLTVKGVNQDYTVTVTDTTSYSKNRDVAKQSDLQVNNSVMISGTSNSQGVVAAEAIVIN